MKDGLDEVSRHDLADAGLVFDGGKFFRGVVTRVPGSFHEDKEWGQVEVPEDEAVSLIQAARRSRVEGQLGGGFVFKSTPVGRGLDSRDAIFYE